MFTISTPFSTIVLRCNRTCQHKLYDLTVILFTIPYLISVSSNIIASLLAVTSAVLPSANFNLYINIILSFLHRIADMVSLLNQ
jgi:hypothetical protein